MYVRSSLGDGNETRGRRSVIMLGMIVGSTIGGVAPMLLGGGVISSLVGSVVGGVLGIWAALRIKESF